MKNDNFKSLAENKTEFMKILANDELLAKCMCSNKPSFKKAEITEEDCENLIYSQIFPFPKTLGRLTDTKSYITMKFKYARSPRTNYFKAGMITFYIFCEESIAKTNYNILRYDYMLQQVDRLVNGKEFVNWFGKLEFIDMEDVSIDNDGKYVGVAVTYRNVEWN